MARSVRTSLNPGMARTEFRLKADDILGLSLTLGIYNGEKYNRYTNQRLHAGVYN